MYFQMALSGLGTSQDTFCIFITPRAKRKEGWRGKFLTRWCNSKDILRSRCVFQDRQSTMGPEHLHILGEALESTIYLLLDAEPFL